MAIGAFSVKGEGEFSSAETPIHGPLVVSRFEHQDARGSFSRLFDQDELFSLG